MTLKISREELSHLRESSIAFADGSGYIAEMAVYHELHCIKRIRRHFHLDRYYPNMTAEDRQKEDVHIGISSVHTSSRLTMYFQARARFSCRYWRY